MRLAKTVFGIESSKKTLKISCLMGMKRKFRA